MGRHNAYLAFVRDCEVPQALTSRNTSSEKRKSVGTPTKLQADDWITELQKQSSDNGDANSTIPPEQALQEAMSELQGLLGLTGVKAEVQRLMSFLSIQASGKSTASKNLDKRFTSFMGNPALGKTTVARIVSKILYGFGLLKTTKLVECERSDLVGGF